MSSALRTPWLGAVAEKELRFALDEMRGYIAGTHVQRGNLSCSPDEIKIELRKKKAVQIIGDFETQEFATGITVSDGTGCISAAFENDAVALFEKQNRRSFQSIRGAIVTITEYQLVLLPAVPPNGRLFLNISSFKLFGSEGSRTFGDPANIANESKVQKLTKCLAGLLSHSSGEDDESFPTQTQYRSWYQVQNAGAGPATQVSFNTQVMNTQLPSAATKSSLDSTEPDNFIQFLGQNVDSEEKYDPSKPSTIGISPLGSIPAEQVQRSTSKLESKFNEQRNQSTNSSQPIKSTNSRPLAALAIEQENYHPRLVSPSISDSDSERVQVEEECSLKQRSYSGERGQKPVVEVELLLQTSSNLLFNDHFQSNNPFNGMKRVPRKYVRTPREQQVLLEGSSWFRTRGSSQAEATLPSRIRDDLKVFVSRKPDMDILQEESDHSNLSNISDDEQWQHLTGQRQLSQDISNDENDESDESDESDENDENHESIGDEDHGHSNGGTALSQSGEQQVQISRDSRFKSAWCQINETEVFQPTSQHDLVKGNLGAHSSDESLPEFPRITTNNSSPITYARVEKHGGTQDLASRPHRHSSCDSDNIVRDWRFDLAVPVELGDFLDEDEDEDKEHETPITYKLPSTAVNKSPIVQVKQTPNITTQFFSKPNTFHHNRRSSDLSSDLVIPATHIDLTAQCNRPNTSTENRPPHVPNIMTVVSEVCELPSAIISTQLDVSPTNFGLCLGVSNANKINSTEEKSAKEQPRKPHCSGTIRKSSTKIRELQQRIAAAIADEEDHPTRNTFQMTKETRMQFKNDEKVQDQASLVVLPLSDIDSALSGASLDFPSIPAPSGWEAMNGPERNTENLELAFIKAAAPVVTNAPETFAMEVCVDKPTLSQEPTPEMVAKIREIAPKETSILYDTASFPKHRQDSEAILEGLPLDNIINDNQSIDSSAQMKSFQEFQASVTHIEKEHILAGEVSRKTYTVNETENRDNVASPQAQSTRANTSFDEHKQVRVNEDQLHDDVVDGPKSHEDPSPDDGTHPRFYSALNGDLLQGDLQNEENRQNHATPHDELAFAESALSSFDKFKSIYPEYTGNQVDFTLALVYIEYLLDNGIFGHSHMCDDFIRFYPEDYLALRGDKMKISGWELFKKKVRRPVFEADVITSENVQESLESLDVEDVARMRARFAGSERGLLFDSRRSSVSRVPSTSSRRETSVATSNISINDPIDLENRANKMAEAIPKVPSSEKPFRRQPFFETASQLPPTKRREPVPISLPSIKRRKTLPWSPEKPETPQLAKTFKSGTLLHSSPILGNPDFVLRSDRGRAARDADPFDTIKRPKETDHRRTLAMAAMLEEKPKQLQRGRSDIISSRKRTMSLSANPAVFRAFVQSQARKGLLSRPSTPSGSPLASGKRFSLKHKESPDSK